MNHGQVFLTVVDGGSPPLNDTAEFTLTVKRNLYGPRCRSQSLVNIPYTQETGVILAYVNATDDDDQVKPFFDRFPFFYFLALFKCIFLSKILDISLDVLQFNIMSLSSFFILSCSYFVIASSSFSKNFFPMLRNHQIANIFNIKCLNCSILTGPNESNSIFPSESGKHSSILQH